MNRIRVLLCLSDGFAPEEGEPRTPEQIQNQVDEWLTSNSPSLCLPKGVSAMIFDVEKGVLLGRID